jgi:hypothetical protein
MCTTTPSHWLRRGSLELFCPGWPQNVVLLSH